MKPRSSVVLFGMLTLFVLVSLACGGSVSTPDAPTSAPFEKPTQASQPEPPSNNNAGGFTTFTDQNDFYQIQVPGDWNYSQSTGEHYYIDQFKSPDEKALVENIAYNDGTPFSGGQNGKFALSLLHQFYSFTGETGDIRISDDKIMPDGSERLTWTSKGGGYSGVSYFEIRDKNTFLMITIEYLNDFEDTYLDTLNAIVESYALP